MDWKYDKGLPGIDLPWGKSTDKNQWAEFNILRDLRKFHQTHNDDNKGTINTSLEYEHINHYLAYMMKTWPFFPNDCYGSTKRHQNFMEVNWCFRGSSVEEIKENLWALGTNFAKECLQEMNKNSPTSMALALRLVWEAKVSSYSECVKRELKVGLNWVRDKEFWDGVNLRLWHKGEVKWNPEPS